jgi:hypothetical protein
MAFIKIRPGRTEIRGGRIVRYTHSSVGAPLPLFDICRLKNSMEDGVVLGVLPPGRGEVSTRGRGRPPLHRPPLHRPPLHRPPLHRPPTIRALLRQTARVERVLFEEGCRQEGEVTMVDRGTQTEEVVVMPVAPSDPDSDFWFLISSLV